MKKKSYWGIIFMTVLLFLAHRSVPFMMDDEWYATNLVTGEALQTLGDILEGQVWHYFNWGGRCITHGVLQLTLMVGEPGADCLNVLMTLLLAYMICTISGEKTPETFLLGFSLLFSLNPNIKMSMFWQSGLVNYIYSSVWILLFLWPYLRAADFAEQKELPGIAAWILPLGFICGWSNENMGPTCFVLSVLVILYRRRVQKGKLPLWMYLGAISSFVGAVLVIVAPGNFVRSAAIEKKSIMTTVSERCFSMFQAGFDFLFPVCLLIVVLLAWYCGYLKERLCVSQIMLLVGMLLSYGAMVLSPHYPDRATFGTMVLGIVLVLSLLDGIVKKVSPMKKYYGLIQLCSWGYGMLALLELTL